MSWYDVIVIDAGGFTFGFSYYTTSEAAARKEFWGRLRRLGKKTKGIRIKECYKV